MNNSEETKDSKLLKNKKTFIEKLFDEDSEEQEEQEEPVQRPKEAPKKEEDYKIEFLPVDFEGFDYEKKIIIIGDSRVGKSSLIAKALKNDFEKDYNSTIGFEFYPFNIKINGKAINMGIWDTSGKEAYRALFSNLYGGISLAIIVYSIDDKESFNNVESWLFNLMEKASEDVKIFLIGNKSDLENNREVTKEEGEKFKLEQCLDLFFETSAKNGNNAKNVFIEAAKMLYDDEQN